MTTSIERTKGTVSQPSGNKTRSEHCQPSLTVDPAARQSHESVVGATASARPARTFSITRHSYGGCDAGGCQLIVSPVRAGTRVATHKLTCPSNCTNCHPVRGESRRQHVLAREMVAYSQGRERMTERARKLMRGRWLPHKQGVDATHSSKHDARGCVDGDGQQRCPIP